MASTLNEIIDHVARLAHDHPKVELGTVPQEIADEYLNRARLLETAVQSIVMIAALDTMKILQP